MLMGDSLRSGRRFALPAVIVLVLALALAACGPATGGGGGDGGRPEIRIGLDPYSYSEVPAYIGLHILKRLGYEARIVNADVGPLFQSLAQGDVDFYVDVWPDVLHVNYLEQYAGQVDVINDLYDDAPVGVGVPGYAPEGLQSIADLNDFIDFTGGRIYALEPGSGMTQTTHAMVEAYGLNYEVMEGSEAAMLSEMSRHFANDRGLVFLLWRPHTMFSKFDIRILDDPELVWGGLSRQSIGMHSGFDVEAGAEAYELWKNMKLSIDEIEEWMLRRDEGAEADELAVEWIDANPDRVKAWLGPYADQWQD